MNKKLILNDADFSSVAINEHDLLYDRQYSAEELESIAINYPVDSRTGAVRGDLTGYKHSVVPVKDFSTIVVSGTFPYHVGAFYSSTSIGTSTFVSCNNQLTKSDDWSYISRTVNIPENAVVLALDLIDDVSDYMLQVKA